MEDDKKIVYHYCDLNAFLSVMSKKSIWLSDVKKSNDEQEGKYLLDLMRQAVEYDKNEKNIEKLILVLNTYFEKSMNVCIYLRGIHMKNWHETMKIVELIYLKPKRIHGGKKIGKWKAT